MLTISITGANDAPVLTGDLAAPIDEAGTYTILAADLGYTDLDDVDAGVTFTTSSLSNGTIQVNGVDATTFTGTQLTAGHVTFLHDGSETLTAAFDVNVEDGNEDSSTPSNSTFNLVVTPVNDAPVLTGDLSAPIGEAGTYTITSTDLGYTDPDDSDADVTFTTSATSNGKIQVNNVDATTFTGTELTSGLVTFVHDGSETLTAAFDVNVEDGNEDSTPPGNSTFNLVVTPVNDAPVLTGDLAAPIGEAGTYTITSTDLGYTDPDDSDAEVTFTTSAASNGKIQVNNVDAATFTGTQLTAGDVTFVHDGTETLTASFAVNVEDGNEDSTPPSNSTFNLVVTPVNDAPVLTGDLAATMDEGTSYTILAADLGYTDPDNVDAEVTFTTSAASNGKIQVNNVDAATFTGTQLTAGDVTFVHDGTETLTASFAVNVEDGNEDSTPPSNSTFNLVVTPVNDAPVLTGDLAAPIGEAGTYTITSTDLGYTDPDDSDAEVTFTTSAASNGKIQVNNVDAATFTGTQLTAGDVTFVHDGSETLTAAFDVNVEDGNEDSSTPSNSTFSFTVIPPVDTTGDVNESGLAENSPDVPADGTTVGDNTHKLVDQALTFDGGFTNVAVQSGSASFGDWSVAANGTFSYELTDVTTDVNAVAETDQFSYTATDDAGNSVTNTVTITIKDDAPLVVLDSGNVTEGATLTVDTASGVLANDTSGADGWDAGGCVVGVVTGFNTAVDTENASVGNVVNGTYGDLTLYADGRYDYVSTADAIAGDETDTFVYTVKDGDGDLESITLTINLSNVTLAAISPTIQVGEAGLPTGTRAAFSDETNGDSLAVVGAVNYAFSTGTDGSGNNGTMTLSATGVYQYTLTSPVTDTTPISDGNNVVADVDVFYYTATDANGNTVDGTITVDVEDDAPLVVLDTDTADEGALVTVDAANGVLADDTSGADGWDAGVGVVGVVATGDTPVIADLDNPGTLNTDITGQYGTLKLQADGSYTYQADPDVIDGNTLDLVDTFAYTVKDGDGDLNSTTLKITLSDVSLQAISPTIQVGEAGLPTGTRADFSDETNGDSLAVVGAVSYAFSTGTDGSGNNGTLTLSATGVYEYTLTSPVTDTTPLSDGNNVVADVDVFYYTATDANGNTVDGTITVDVKDDAPLVVLDTDTADEGALVTVDAANGVLANDISGADDWTAGGGVVGVVATVDTPVIADLDSPGTLGGPGIAGQYGTLTLEADGSYTYQANPDVIDGTELDLVDTFVYTVKDGDGDLNSTTLKITLSNVNDVPEITGDLAAPIDEAGTYMITSTDIGYTDTDDGDADVTFTTSGASNGKIQVNGFDATTFTGTQLTAGDVTFVHDGTETLTAAFDVNVEDGNEDVSTPVNSTFNFAVTPVDFMATDNDYTVGITLSAVDLVTDGLVQNFDASTDVVGDDIWTSDPANSFNWDFDGGRNSGTFSPVPVTSSFSGITEAYRFDGSQGAVLSDGRGVSGESYSNMPGDPTNNDASFEIWLKAAGLTSREVLFESGATTDGVSLRLNGSTLEFFVKDGSADVKLSYDLGLASIDPSAEFVQITGVIEIGSTISLYVNGALVAEDTSGVTVDWAGSDDAGLGGTEGGINFDSPANFEGDIASFRFYDKALSAVEVHDNYQAVAMPGTLSIDFTNTIANLVTDSVADENDAAVPSPIEVDSLTLGFDAAIDTVADDTWDSAPANNFGWDFDGVSSSGSFSADAVTSSLPGITKAYNFDGTGGAVLSDDSGGDDSFDDILGDPTNGDASFEIWFKAEDITDHDVLFESGAAGDGVSIRLNGTVLEFYVKDGNASVLHDYDLSTIGIDPRTEFLQVIGVITISGNVELYVNGTLAAVDTSGVIQDWAGANGAGLGATSSSINFDAPTAFEGDIASFNFYEKALTAEDVLNNYQAVAGMAVTAVNGMAVSLTDGVVLEGGTLFIAADGSFNFDPNEDFSGLQQFTYTLENNQGETDDAVVTITVDGAITGTDGDDVLSGTAGEDVLFSLNGTDNISGGEGNDFLVGGDGQDTFVWISGDDGSAAIPSIDVVRDFTVGDISADGDILNFSELLIGASSDAMTLDEFMDFSFNGVDTLIDLKTAGVGSPVTQQVVLEGSNLAAGAVTDLDVLGTLLSNGQLVTD